MARSGNVPDIDVPKLGTSVPNLGTIDGQTALAAALFGETRGAVLALLYGHPDESFHLRRIARVAGHGLGAVQRELERLTNAGVVRRCVRGRQVYFQANHDCAIFSELQRLILKTAGLADVLRTALAELSNRIQMALVYGSLAKGDFSASSDVDVLIVGDASFAEVVAALGPAQETLAREINPSVYSPEDFCARVARRDHFVTAILAAPTILLIGDAHDLVGVAQERLAH